MKNISYSLLLLLTLGVTACTKEKLDKTESSAKLTRVITRLTERTEAVNAEYTTKNLIRIRANSLVITADGQLAKTGLGDKVTFQIDQLKPGVTGRYTLRSKNGSGDVYMNYWYAENTSSRTILTNFDSDHNTVEGVVEITSYNQDAKTMSCSYTVTLKGITDPRVPSAHPTKDSCQILLMGHAKNISVR